MNVAELSPGTYGTLGHYVATAIPFTIFTIWIIVAYQIQIRDPHSAEGLLEEPIEKTEEPGPLLQGQKVAGFRRMDLWERLWWPAILVSTMMERRKQRRETRKAPPSFTITHI